MRTKKWAVALLAVALMLCLLPTAAFAAGNNLVWLNNAWLSEGETTIGEGKVTLDAENKTLTLENVALTSWVDIETDGFTLIAKGTNSIIPSNNNELGLYVRQGSLKIVLEESASLTISAETSNAIYIPSGDLNVSGAGTLTLETDGEIYDEDAEEVYRWPTLYVGGDVTIEDATLNITGNQVGRFTEIYDEVEDESTPTEITMRNATVNIDVTAGTNQAVFCALGSVTIEDTALTTKTKVTSEEIEGYGLYVVGPILIKGDKTDIKHTGAVGFDADSITIESGKVDVKSNGTALLGYNGVTITGGTVKAESEDSYAILGTKGLVSVTGASTEVTAITSSEVYAAISNANNPSNPDFGDGGIHLDAKITVEGKNLIVGVKKDAEAAITLGEDFEIAGATLKSESLSSTKTMTYFVDEEGNALTGSAVVCKHTFGETPTWTWAEDGSSATASFPCTESGDYTEVVNATITSETTPATCIAAGKTVYTAKVTFGGKEYSDVKEITLAIDEDAHGETELKNAKEATCTEKGYTGDKVCKDCGKVAEAGEEIPMKEHTFVNGKCEVCGADDPNYVPDTSSDDTSSDVSSDTPSDDASSDDASSVASSGTDSSETPDTGSSSALIWLLLAAACVGGTVLVLRKRNA